MKSTLLSLIFFSLSALGADLKTQGLPCGTEAVVKVFQLQAGWWAQQGNETVSLKLISISPLRRGTPDEIFYDIKVEVDTAIQGSESVDYRAQFMKDKNGQCVYMSVGPRDK